MEFLNDYLVLIVMGVCLCVGYLIKHTFNNAKLNKFIPLIVAVLGVLINMWINLAISPEILLGGLASGLASTGMHQMFKKFIEKE